MRESSALDNPPHRLENADPALGIPLTKWATKFLNMSKMSLRASRVCRAALHDLIHRQPELRKPDAGLNRSSTPQPAKSVRRDQRWHPRELIHIDKIHAGPFRAVAETSSPSGICAVVPMHDTALPNRIGEELGRALGKPQTGIG
jgi:hypothetical protein